MHAPPQLRMPPPVAIFDGWIPRSARFAPKARFVKKLAFGWRSAFSAAPKLFTSVRALSPCGSNPLNSGPVNAKFRAMRYQPRLAVLTAVLAAAAAAQSMECREVARKAITCTRTGLSSDLKDCGVRPNWATFSWVPFPPSLPPGKTKKDSNRAAGGFPRKSPASL
jgi:hypothetical protein